MRCGQVGQRYGKDNLPTDGGSSDVVIPISSRRSELIMPAVRVQAHPTEEEMMNTAATRPAGASRLLNA